MRSLKFIGFIGCLVVIIFSHSWSLANPCDLSFQPDVEISTGEWTKTGFARANIALVKAGNGHFVTPQKEHELIKNGADVIMIKNPSSIDLSVLTEDRGYHYGPLFISRVKPTMDMFDEIDSQNDKTEKQRKKSKDTLKRKLKKTDENSDYNVTIQALNVEGLNELKRVFYDTVGKKEFAVDTFSDEFINSKIQEIKKGVHSNFQLLIKHKDFGVVGGMVLEVLDEGMAIKVKRAAYSKDPEHKSNYLSIRAVYELTKFALKNYIPTLSYGSDPNFYGELTSLGLMKFKSELGFGVAPGEVFAEPRLVKVLNPEVIGPYVTFSYKDLEKQKGFVAHVYGTSEVESLPKGIEVIFH
ncbi:MAG: hypothetical protein KDD58_08430 [Bdellovibrionales bacterium]|nr:hypothetical protein [Bdellovibrionales bacterium]